MTLPISTRFLRLWPLLAIAGTLLALAALSLSPGAASGQSAPAVSDVAVTSAPSADNTYARGETIRVTLTFSEAVDVTGAPRLKIKMDPDYGEKWAVGESGKGTTELTFAYEVVEPNISTQGIAVLENTLELVKKRATDVYTPILRSTTTEALADLSHAGLAHDANHKVQCCPKAVAVAVVSDPGDDDTYGLDDVIRIRVTFDETVDVTGTPRVTFDLDPAHWGQKWAVYEGGTGTTELTFTYTVVARNESTQGIAVLENTLGLNGGTIESVSDGANAHLAHDGLAHDPEHKVDGTPPTPTVTDVAVVSDPGDDDTYGLDDVIRIRVTFDEAVDVTGTPRVTFDLDPAHWGEKWARYESGSGTTELTFAYTVVEPNESPQGIAVLADSLARAGGTIESVSYQADENLSHGGLGHDANHKVDWGS